MVQTGAIKTGNRYRAAFVVRGTVDSMRALGVDVNRVLARIGLDLDALGEHGRVPMSKVRALWDEVERTSGHDMIGIEVARLAQLGQLDVLGQVVRTSATVRAALARTERYFALLTDAWRFELIERGPSAVIRLHVAEDEHPQVVECLVATIGMLGRGMTGKPLVAQKVLLRHAEPPRAQRMRAEFGPNIVFGQPHDELWFDSAVLDLPVLGHDPALCMVLDRHAEQMLSQLPARGEFVGEVREAVIAGLREGKSRSLDVAELLHVSERTLRRKLAQHGVTFQQILDEARHALARRYLEGTNLDAAEVGFHLGFANASAFARAFRRWAGCSPLEYRRRTQALLG